MTLAAESAPQVNRALIAMIVIVATIGGFMFGYDSGVINGTQAGLESTRAAGSQGLELLIRTESKRWADVVKSANIKAD